MIKIVNIPSLYVSLNKAIEICSENIGKNIEIIVPDKLSLFMEKFLFAKLNIESTFNIKVTTFNRFAKKDLIVDKDKQLSKVGSILLIHKILNDNLEKFKVIKSKAYSLSYAEEIADTLNQLRASKIRFEEMQKFNSKNELLTGKIQDLALIYEQYENLKAGKLDSLDMFLMSTLTVGSGYKNKLILLVGFDDFTAVEYSIIEQLIPNNQVVVLNYKSSANNKNLYSDEVLFQLKNLAVINNYKYEVEDCKIETNDLKGYLTTNLFGFKNNSFVDEDLCINLYRGNSINDEIENCARTIKQKIISNNRFGEFGVCCFNLENNLQKIKEIFDKYEINWYLDGKMTLNNSILIKFINSILKYNIESYNISHTIDLISSPFFELNDNDKRNIIDKLISVNFVGKIKNSTSFNLDEKLEIKLTEYMSLFDMKDCNTTRDIVTRIKEIILSLRIDEKIKNLIDNSVDLQHRLLISKSKEIVDSLCEEILCYDSNLDLNNFYEVFSSLTEVVSVNNLPLSLDAVKIIDANDNMEIFDYLFILNCNNDNAPNLKNDCGIILDKEIDELNFKYKLAPTIARINKLSKLRLFNLAGLFEKELYISYNKNPSELIGEIKNKINIKIHNIEIGVVTMTQDNLSKLYEVLSPNDYLDFLCKHEKNNKMLEKVVKNKDFSNISTKNLGIFENLKNISPSQLENYFKCPFNNFLNNQLKIKPRLEDEILSFDVGNVLHEILYKYYKQNKQVGDVYDFCKNEVFSYLKKVERLKLKLDSPLLLNLIDEANRILNGVDYIDENSNFTPKLFEHEFKDTSSLKLKNVNIIGKVDRVDECDGMLRIVDYKSGKADASLKELFYGDKLQLFLYSLAIEKEFKSKVVGNFYLPLHNTYQQNEGNPYSMKGFYLNEDFVVTNFDKRLEPNMTSDIVNVKLNKSNKANRTNGYKELTDDEYNSLKNYSKQVSEQAVNEIKSGFILPSPSGVSEPCKYCPYGAICLHESNGFGLRCTKRIDLSSFKEENND